MGPENDKYDTSKSCAEVVKDKREIQRVTDTLEIEISSLQNTVKRLFDVLEPITRPSNPTEGNCGDKEEGTTTSLGNTIFNYVRCLRTINDELSDTLRRIEL